MNPIKGRNKADGEGDGEGEVDKKVDGGYERAIVHRYHASIILGVAAAYNIEPKNSVNQRVRCLNGSAIAVMTASMMRFFLENSYFSLRWTKTVIQMKKTSRRKKPKERTVCASIPSVEIWNKRGSHAFQFTPVA